MQYKTIVYKRIKNLGNYQSETVEMTIELSEGDDVGKCFEDLKLSVEKALNLNVEDDLEAF